MGIGPAWARCMSLFASERLRVGSGEVPRGEKMLKSGTDPESCVTEHILVCEDDRLRVGPTQSRMSPNIL